LTWSARDRPHGGRLERRHRGVAFAVGYDQLLLSRLFIGVGGGRVRQRRPGRRPRRLPGLPPSVFFAAGTSGPAGAMVVNLTAEPIRATALGTLTLANNLLGLAAGPFVVGLLADGVGLVTAMRFVPIAALAAAAILYVGRLVYPVSLEMVRSHGVTR
jgi:MFS family permease